MRTRQAHHDNKAVDAQLRIKPEDRDESYRDEQYNEWWRAQTKVVPSQQQQEITHLN